MRSIPPCLRGRTLATPPSGTLGKCSRDRSPAARNSLTSPLPPYLLLTSIVEVDSNIYIGRETFNSTHSVFPTGTLQGDTLTRLFISESCGGVWHTLWLLNPQPISPLHRRYRIPGTGVQQCNCAPHWLCDARGLGAPRCNLHWSVSFGGGGARASSKKITPPPRAGLTAVLLVRRGLDKACTYPTFSLRLRAASLLPITIRARFVKMCLQGGDCTHAACLPRYPQHSQGVPQRCEFDVSLPLNKDSHVAAVRDAVAKTVRSTPHVFLGNSRLTCHLTCFCSNPFFLTTVDAVYQWNIPLQQVVLSGRRLNQHF